MKNDDFLGLEGCGKMDFEKSEPPLLTENMLKKEDDRRKLKRQIRVLRFSAFLTCIFMAVLTFITAQGSILFSALCASVLCIYITGSLIISVLFYKKGYGIFSF